MINASITGKTSEQQTNISIFVSPTAPVLNIISPENKYYQINIPILVEYTERFSKNLWYNLDNKENISINSSFLINPDFGAHTLFLYANNSIGTTMKNVGFFVTASLINEASGGGGSEGRVEGNLKKWLIIKVEIPSEIFLGEILLQK